MKRISIVKNFRNRLRPMPTRPIFGSGLRLAGQRGGCPKRMRKFAGLRKQIANKMLKFKGLRSQRGGCKMQGKGVTVAGQHGGLNVGRYLNRKIIKPAGRWLSKNIVDVSNVAGNLLPLAAMAI